MRQKIWYSCTQRQNTHLRDQQLKVVQRDRSRQQWLRLKTCSVTKMGEPCIGHPLTCLCTVFIVTICTNSLHTSATHWELPKRRSWVPFIFVFPELFLFPGVWSMFKIRKRKDWWFHKFTNPMGRISAFKIYPYNSPNSFCKTSITLIPKPDKYSIGKR